MKRLIVFVSLVFITLLLVSCGTAKTVPIIPDPAPDQVRPSSDSGLSLTIEEDIFNGSPTHIHTVLKNDSERTYGYGDFYHIEHLVNNHWHMITYSDLVFTSNSKFKDSGRLIKPGEETTQSFSVEQLGVTLLPGEYRLVKTFLVQGEPFHEVSVAAAFSVE